MSKLWDDLKDNMKDWSKTAVEKAEEMSKMAVAKTEEMTLISKVKFDIHHQKHSEILYNTHYYKTSISINPPYSTFPTSCC